MNNNSLEKEVCKKTNDLLCYYLLGLTQVSGFNRPSEAVEHLDFKDNSINFEDDNKFGINGDYNYRPGKTIQSIYNPKSHLRKVLQYVMCFRSLHTKPSHANVQCHE